MLFSDSPLDDDSGLDGTTDGGLVHPMLEQWGPPTPWGQCGQGRARRTSRATLRLTLADGETSAALDLIASAGPGAAELQWRASDSGRY